MNNQSKNENNLNVNEMNEETALSDEMIELKFEAPLIEKVSEEIESIKELVAPPEFLAPSEVDEHMARLNAAIASQEQELLESVTAAAEIEQATANAAQEEEIRLLEEAELAESLEEEEETVRIPLEPSEIESCLEALFFMAEKPMTLERLKTLLGEEITDELLLSSIEALKMRYNELHHGLELLDIAGGYQLRVKASRSFLAKKLAKVQVQRLSRGTMETLAIVAYRQPVLKDEIDQIRGVDSSHFVRALLDRKLIEISGRSELPGRPMLYSTTNDFLEVFALNQVTDLPPLSELENMVPSSEAGTGEDDPRVKKLRALVGEMKADLTRIDYDPKEDESFLENIREKVKSISISTPTLEAMKEAEKAEKSAKTEAEVAQEFLQKTPPAFSSTSSEKEQNS